MNSISDVEEPNTHRSTLSLTPAEKQAGEAYGRTRTSLVHLGKEAAELGAIDPRTLTEAQQARLAEIDAVLDAAQREFRQALVAIEQGFRQQGASRAVEFGKKMINSGLRTIVRKMGPGTILIHYLVLPDTLRILVTTPDVIEVRTVAVTQEELEQLVQAFRQALQTPDGDPQPLAKRLYALLIDPIEQDLGEAAAKTLMVSLDGTLRYIPLAALQNAQGYLVERYAVNVFTEAARDKIAFEPYKSWKIACFGVSEEHPPFAALPAVPGELRGILGNPADQNAGILPGEEYLNRQFTRRSFRHALRAQFSVLHIASHFQFKPGEDLASFLLLGGTDPGSTPTAPRDGENEGGCAVRQPLYLSLQEIQDTNYDMGDVDLLTLSACQTAMGGKGATGREVESFGVLAQEKGARSVLATLWPVADASTGAFMQAFYALHQEKHLSKAEALRQAQLRFLRGEIRPTMERASRGVPLQDDDGNKAPAAPQNGDYRHPFYWAPFILMGNWR